jgi:hypothetical protein
MKKISMISGLLLAFTYLACSQFDPTTLYGEWEVVNIKGAKVESSLGATFTWDDQGNMMTIKALEFPGTYKIEGNKLTFTAMETNFVYNVSMRDDLLILNPEGTEDEMHLKKK